MASRHAARRFAVQALYALEMNPDGAILEGIEAVLAASGGRASDREFVEALVRGAWEHRAELDEIIQRYSRRWKLHRLDRVDKGVLRLAAHELLYRLETPAPVILDEGVELAKEFGSDDSPAFVNGILDGIAHEYRQDELGERQG